MSSGEIAPTTTPRQHPDQALLLKPDDCLMHRSAAHAELGGDLLFGPLVTGREDVVPDCLFQSVVGPAHQRRLLGLDVLGDPDVKHFQAPAPFGSEPSLAGSAASMQVATF